MRKRYHHRTLELRTQISVLISMEMSYRAIGQKLGLRHSTVGREIRRNTDPQEYVALFAQTQAQKRRKCVSGISKVLPQSSKPLLLSFFSKISARSKSAGGSRKQPRALGVTKRYIALLGRIKNREALSIRP